MEVFSRGVQSGIGIAVGYVLFAVAIGGMYAVVYSLAYGRIGVLKARALAMLLAGAGFLLVYLVPFLKYPANPPAVGHEDTIGPRSGLYLTMVAASLLFGVLATALARRLTRKMTTWSAVLIAGAAFAVVMGVLMLLLPTVGELSADVATYGRHATETPLPLLNPQGAIVFPGFDADVLYRFRLYSLIAQLIIWGVIGLIFGVLAERLMERSGQRAVRTQSPQTADVEPARR